MQKINNNNKKNNNEKKWRSWEKVLYVIIIQKKERAQNWKMRSTRRIATATALKEVITTRKPIINVKMHVGEFSFQRIYKK